MTPRLVLEPAAQHELADGLAWYEEHSPPKIANDFLVSVGDTLDRIEASPLQFAQEHRDVRKAVVPHFPYLILFIPLPDIIAVIAIFHTSRDPAVWIRRAAG